MHKICYFCDDLKDMKTRLLILSILSLLCATLFNVVNQHCHRQQNLAEIIADHISDHELSAPDQKLILPRQSNFAAPSQTRTISKRHNNHRSVTRSIFIISGKPVDFNFVRTYQQLINLFPTGLCDTQRLFISLGKLTI